jgi:hypothetical protein
MDPQAEDILKVIIVGFFGSVVTPLVANAINQRRRKIPNRAIRDPEAKPGARFERVEPTVRPSTSPNREDKNGLKLPETTAKIPGERESMRMPRWTTIVLWAVIGGIIFGLLMYFLTKPNFISSCPFFASTSVTITSPASDDRASNQITVQGTACNIPPDKGLWLLVTVEGIGGYFPQGDAANPRPIVVRNDGTWSVAAYIGSSADTGRKFTLIPALVDQNDIEAKDAIQAYFTQPGPVYKGIEPLPGGIQLMPSISVIHT